MFMPYIIAVLTLVVVGVGFTLFQSPDQTTDLPDTISTEMLTDASVPTIEQAETEVEQEQEREEEKKWNDDDDEDEDEDEEKEEDEDKKTKNQTPVTQPATMETTPLPAPTPAPTPTTVAYDYKDSTYTSHVSYRTPEGNYSMDVTITVTNDEVTAVSTMYDSKAARDSYTKRFDRSYSTYVTGKDLAAISLSRVGGASLTSNAFNKAVANIKTQASA